MRDGRYFDLERAARLEGLPAEYAELANKPMKPNDAERWAFLFRGYVFELGRLLGAADTTATRGLAAGRYLLADLLADNSECEKRPHAPIRYEEWQQIKDKMNLDSMTCARLLKMLRGTTDQINLRRAETAAASTANAAA